jgi:Bromodomain
MSDSMLVTDNEDHDSMAIVASLYSVMSTLYCLSIAADFRKPVEMLYPNIAASYLSVIKNPMDLGTLLLECMKGIATINSIRQGLRLVFSNSLRFNAGSPMMEAISEHLESFAGGLFEEATKLPFIEKKQYQTDFRTQLVQKRSYRLSSVCKLPLTEMEIRCVEDNLLSVQENVPMELETPLAALMETILSYYSRLGSQDKCEETAPVLTLELLFLPFVEAAKAPSLISVTDAEACSILPSLIGLLGIPIEIERKPDVPPVTQNNIAPLDSKESCSANMLGVAASQTLTSLSDVTPVVLVDSLMSVDMIGSHSEDKQDQMLHLGNLPLNSNEMTAPEFSAACISSTSSDDTVKTQNMPIIPATLLYLHALDDALGTLFVRLEERILRGTNHSSVWQRPLALMWAQPAKVTPACTPKHTTLAHTHALSYPSERELNLIQILLLCAVAYLV